MTTLDSKLHVTKLAAAERQLRAAIRLFFKGEDELAVHSVAAAAYGLLKDLKSHRGRNEAADIYRNAIFYAVRDYHRGTLPDYLEGDPATLAFIKDIAETSNISANSHLDDFDVSISSETTRYFWNNHNVTVNFLKHADRDPDGHLSMDQFDNSGLLLHAYSSYMDLTRDTLYPEGFVLSIYSSVTNGVIDGLADSTEKFVRRLDSLGQSERKCFCLQLIEELRKRTE